MSSLRDGEARASASSAVRMASSEAALDGARAAYGDPHVELLALPLSLLFGLVITASGFGTLLTALVQIQFHELGHALCAWLTSRAALPLPFGVTFISERPSAFVTLCMLFLLGLFTFHSTRERRYVAAALGGSLAVVVLTLAVGGEQRDAFSFFLFGGFVGELALPALTMLLFYVRLPDRLRWDFFRFLALPPSAAAWLLSVRTWRKIAAHDLSLPTRSFLPGDGSSDFSRLMERGFSADTITTCALRLSKATMLVLAVVYLAFAVRAVKRLRAR